MVFELNGVNKGAKDTKGSVKEKDDMFRLCGVIRATNFMLVNGPAVT